MLGNSREAAIPSTIGWYQYQVPLEARREKATAELVHFTVKDIARLQGKSAIWVFEKDLDDSASCARLQLGVLRSNFN